MNKYPAITAVRNITAIIMITNFLRKILASMVISGIAIPAPPITKAMTVPILIPLAISATPMGIAVSARMYSGMPKTAATGIANKLSGPAIFNTKS